LNFKSKISLRIFFAQFRSLMKLFFWMTQRNETRSFFFSLFVLFLLVNNVLRYFHSKCFTRLTWLACCVTEENHI
jgi:hypothetical protein